MKLKKFTITFILLVISSQLIAAPLVNDMQACQGMISFIEAKLESASSKFEAEDVKTIRKGLEGYDQYIQQEIITPGLLKFNGGDEAKANLMQTQVDGYKKTLVKSLQVRYPQNRLFYDHVVAVNNCSKKAVPSGQALEDLKVAFATLVKLTKIE